MHSCPDCGLGHEAPQAETAPEIIATEPPTSDNDVRIAEIEAAARVETEKIYAGERDQELVAEVERLRGELDGMRTVLETLTAPPPDPDPVVVPIPDPAPEPEVEPVASPPPVEPKSEKKNTGFWGPAYG